MESFATISSTRLRYQEWQPAAPSWLKRHSHNKHLLFIHGLGSSSDRWLDIPQALSLAGLHSIALDLPGFGASYKPSTDNTIDYFTEMVADFMLQKKLDMRNTSLIGHSLGGYIAAHLAADNNVDRLVLIDTSGMLRGPTLLLQEYAAANPSFLLPVVIVAAMSSAKVETREGIVMYRTTAKSRVFLNHFDAMCELIEKTPTN